jgi:hypothetical protein
VATNATCGREERREKREERRKKKFLMSFFTACVVNFVGGSTKLNRQVDKAIHAI